MEKKVRKYGVMVVVVWLFLAVLCAGCRHQTKRRSQLDWEKYESALNDSINLMRVDFSRQVIDNALKIAPDSDVYYTYLLYKAILYYYTSEPDSLFDEVTRCRHYLQSVPKTESRKKLWMKYYQVASSYYGQYVLNLDSLVYYTRQACIVADDGMDDETRIMCYGNLADAYKQCGDLAKSAYYYRKAVFLADSIHAAPSDYIYLYSGLGSVYTNLEDFEQSGYWWDKAFTLWKYMVKNDRFIYYNNRGNDYYYQKDYVSCLKMFQALDTFLLRTNATEWDHNFCYANLADVYLRLGECDKAYQLLKPAMSYFSRMNVETVMSHLNTQLMEYYRQTGQYDKVARLLHDHPLPEKSKPEQILLREELKMKYYQSVKDWHKAFLAEQAYHDISDSLRNVKVKMRAVDLQMRYERDTTVLQQKVLITHANSRLMATYMWLSWAVGFSVLLVFWMIYRNKKNKLRETQMLQHIVSLRMENIRNRITPHFIYNALNHEMLSMQEGKPVRFETLVRLLRQGQLHANEFCIPLKEELDFIDLYVRVEGEALGPDFVYRLEIHDQIDPAQVILPSMMVQIIVENAIKHGLKCKIYEPGEPQKLCLTVFREQCDIIIEVKNNGALLGEQSYQKKARIGLNVINQTIMMLNEHNRRHMSYSMSNYHSDDGESGCCARLVIPENYDFRFN